MNDDTAGENPFDGSSKLRSSKLTHMERTNMEEPEVSYDEETLSEAEFERLRDEAHAVFLKSIESVDFDHTRKAPEDVPILGSNCPTPEEMMQDPAIRKTMEAGEDSPKVHWSGDLTEKDLKRLTYAFPEGQPLIPLLGDPPGYNRPTEYEVKHFGLPTGIEGTFDDASDVTEEWLQQAGAWQHYITENPAFKPMRDFLVSQGVQEEDVSSCYRRYLQAVALIPDGEPVSSRVSDLLPKGIAPLKLGYVEPKYFLMLRDAMSSYLGGDYAPVLRSLAGCIRDLKALEKELDSWGLTDEELYLLGRWFSEEEIMVRREALPRFVGICKSIEKHTAIEDFDGVEETSFTRGGYWFGARSIFQVRGHPEWRVLAGAAISRYGFEQEASKRKLSLAEISHLVNHIDLSSLEAGAEMDDEMTMNAMLAEIDQQLEAESLRRNRTPVTKAAQATGSAMLSGAQLAGANRLNDLLSQAVLRVLAGLDIDASTLDSQVIQVLVKAISPLVLHFACEHFGEALPGSALLQKGSEMAMQATVFEFVSKALNHFDLTEIQEQAKQAALEAPKRDLVEETVQVEAEKKEKVGC